jgi:D-3-phosphoglycerate dehydrogenase
MKVLVADSMSDSFVARLQAAGIEVQYDPKAKDAGLVDALRSSRAEVLVVRSTKVSHEAIVAGGNLELIVRAGAGYDTIDVDSASANGIFVANCPGKNATAVAELTMALILALDRFIPENVVDAREGLWNKAKYSTARGIKGQTLGLIGLGNIGTEVAERALAFGLKIVGWSRSLTPSRAKALGIEYAESPAEVARAADIVSVHVASSADTKHLINRDFFRQMKDGAYFVNTTRSAVVDEEALLDAIDSKNLRVGLDVFEGEPSAKEGSLDIALAKHPNVYLSHHIGASTEQAQEAIAEEAARVIVTYRTEGDAPNCVNIAAHTPATHQITVRHLDKVGVLARVLNEMSKAGWNVQEMENLVFDGAVAACARIRFDGQPDEAATDRITKLDDVLATTVIRL